MPIQNRADPLQPRPNNTSKPVWATNGSFLVFRRLRQDVAGRWQFMHVRAKRLAAKYPSLASLTTEQLTALFVGRWPSGALVMRAPNAEIPCPAEHEFAINDFQVSHATDPSRLIPSVANPPDNFPPSRANASGLRCPFAAHICKVNPRADTTKLGSPEQTLLKRIIRRGIPFSDVLAKPLQSTRVRRARPPACFPSSIR